MEKEFMNGVMDDFIMEITQIAEKMDLDNIDGWMKENTQENGKMGISMEKGKLYQNMVKIKKERG